MLNSVETIRRANDLGTDASLAIATLSFDGFERLLSRQFQFAKSVLGEQMQMLSARPAGVAPEIEDMVRDCELQLQKVFDLSRDCMQIGFTTQGEISRRVRETMDGLARNGETAEPAAPVQAIPADEEAPAKSRRAR